MTNLDLIWDSYPDQSLIRLVQEKRGGSAGCRTKVQGPLEQYLTTPEKKADVFR